MPAAREMPRTLQRSTGKAQATWAKTHDNAVQRYGEGERAHRTAFAALKHSFEKVGDRWEPKRAKGPSDPRAKEPAARARRGVGETFGGVDYYGHTVAELARRAKRLSIRGTSRMTKRELARAIARKQK